MSLCRCLAQFLRSSQADIVLLQEVFTRADVFQLSDSAKAGKLKHSHFFHGGMLQGELLLLSAYPIHKAHFHGYAVAGDPSAPTHGDYYAGKGIGHAVLQTPAGRLTVFNTHTCANYSHDYRGMQHVLVSCDADEPAKSIRCRVPVDTDAAIRVSQVLQLASLVQALHKQDHLGTIVAGDLNCPPDSLEMHLFRALLPHLHDCWQVLHPNQPGYTANAADNTFTKPGGDAPCRIDYIWLSGNPDKASRTMQTAQNRLSYSDHLGVEAICTFGEVYTDRPSAATAHDIISKHPELFKIAQGILQQGADTYQRSRKHWLLLAVLLFCTALVASLYAAAHPWWHDHKAVLPVLLCVVAVCFTLAPISFILGFAGFGGVAAALREDVQSLQLHLPA